MKNIENQISLQESYALNIIRVIATIFIFLCHLVQIYPSVKVRNIGQIFNVGVVMFFFISGYLYSNKNIINFKKWFIKRYLKISFPIVLFTSLISVIISKFNVMSFLCYALNLQGILFNYSINGVGHLWFISVLAICYLITPILQRLRFLSGTNKHRFIALIIFQVFMAIFGSEICSIYLVYIYCYSLWFVTSNKLEKFLSRKILLYSFIGISISVVSRFIFKFIDDRYMNNLTNRIYQCIIVPYTQAVLGFCLIIIIFYFAMSYSTVKKIKSAIAVLDKYSFEIYIVHYIFIANTFNLINTSGNFPANIVSIVTLTAVSAFVLHWITEFILNLIIMRNFKLFKYKNEFSYSNKIRIIHILNTGSYSGAENVVIKIINSIKNDFEFFYVSLDGTIRKKLESEDINFYDIKKMGIFQIRKAIKELNPDIIHAHDYKASLLCAFSGISVPIISHIHNNAPWIRKRGIYSLGYLLSTFRYKKILMVSNSILNEYIFGKFIQNRSVIIGNPIDNSLIIEKSKLEINDKFYDVIFLGRLSKAKNPLKFIDIIECLISSNNKIKSAMIGSGEMLELCKKQIEDKNLLENIDILGFIDNPYPILANSKLLVITSEWEGFGLAAAEALALGMPVISTAVGGLMEIVDNDCGKLCENNNDILMEIKSLLEDDQYYSSKSRKALKKADLIENMEDYSNKMKSLYNKLIN